MMPSMSSMPSMPSMSSMMSNSYSGVYGGAQTSSHGPLISLETFKTHVFPCNNLPQGLPDCIFSAFDASNKGTGLCFDDYATSMSVLMRGTDEQKTKLLFHVYDVQRDGEVRRSKMLQFMAAIYGRPVADSRQTQRAVLDLYSSSSTAGSVRFGDFHPYVTYDNFHVCSQWFSRLVPHILSLPSPRFLALARRYDPQAGLPRLRSCYKLTDAHVTSMKRAYRRYAGGRPGRHFDLQAFLALSLGFLPPRLAERVFEANARTLPDRWTVGDYVSFACAFARGGEAERLRFAWACFARGRPRRGAKGDGGDGRIADGRDAG
eukprot:CAMPEP_0197548672 /NCGR_PEP_ID=MMETSP1320-20131121/2741_1 /TAXON_ID=91990 /ORGANISM="Bolidomonas sp., Strain RCC2347" /LENGTH=318 /DNA_ID=CAMNT_0043108737 /DNA_START=311 /DNA_END=1264 /DNA_ORIENTATION=-